MSARRELSALLDKYRMLNANNAALIVSNEALTSRIRELEEANERHVKGGKSTAQFIENQERLLDRANGDLANLRQMVRETKAQLKESRAAVDDVRLRTELASYTQEPESARRLYNFVTGKSDLPADATNLNEKKA